MMTEKLRTLPLRAVRIDDGLWNHYIGLVETVILPFMWELINDRVPGAEKSYCIENFRIAAGESEGRHRGMVFQDTDVAKWLEAAAFALAKKRDPKLEETADLAIDLIGRAQEPDGYLNTYYTLTGEPRWSDLLEGHELYTAGHLIEAAVAYYEATGKRKFLDIMLRNVECIENAFGCEEGKLRGYPGHPEIELALMKLYRVTKEERCLRLAEYFIRERGARPVIFDQQECRATGKYIFPEFADFDYDYCQADRPLAEQREAEGHSVRAMYLYSGMTDLAAALQDEELFRQCEALWEDVVERKMYITGSIGSASYGERFTGPYDLPNDTNYSESCASIGLAMFGIRMFAATRDGRYIDVVERALYNTVLAGIALDGKHYFYVNPLAVNPEREEQNPTYRHVKTVRQQWFGVACCPPNIARTLASIGNYLYACDDRTVYLNLFIQNETDVELASGAKFSMAVTADYPKSGKIAVRMSGMKAEGEEFALAVRIPGYADGFEASVNGDALSIFPEKGYLYVQRTWKNGDVLELELSIDYRFVYCNPKVDANVGKTALVKGPWVYCIEEADNGKMLASVYADTSSAIRPVAVEGLPEGIQAVEFDGLKIAEDEDASLYRRSRPRYEELAVRAVPYCMWNNRGRGEMYVWLNELR